METQTKSRKYCEFHLIFVSKKSWHSSQKISCDDFGTQDSTVVVGEIHTLGQVTYLTSNNINTTHALKPTTHPPWCVSRPGIPPWCRDVDLCAELQLMVVFTPSDAQLCSHSPMCSEMTATWCQIAWNRANKVFAPARENFRECVVTQIGVCGVCECYFLGDRKFARDVSNFLRIWPRYWCLIRASLPRCAG